MKHPSIRSLVAVLAMVAALVAVIAPTSAVATSPSQVTITWNGCRGDTDSYIATGDANTPFVCGDDQYTGGNLGTGWAELDLVPYRLTTEIKDQTGVTTSYDLRWTGDYFDAQGNGPGYDFITVPMVNPDLSDSSCAITVGSLTINADQTLIYRPVHISQDLNTTCVFDTDYRIAVGASTMPGAALHAHTTNETGGTQNVGSRDVPINPGNIAPQSINKDMSASQGSDHVWDITKSPTPASLDFGNTCDVTAGSHSLGVQIEVDWTKEAATPSGDITIITHVYATNPAHRDITVNVTDDIYSGSDQTNLVDEDNSGDVNVLANTTQLVLTHTTTAAAGPTEFNDVATATYKDTLLGIPVPGTTTDSALATVDNNGPVTNDTATINDVESITGSGLSFSVDSFSGASGSFDGGYIAGTETTGDVSWTSDSQSDSGSVTFDKTVYFTAPGNVSGELDDTATVTGSDGFSASTDASVAITAHTQATLTVTKTIDVPAHGDLTFDFTLNGGGFTNDPFSVVISDGDTSGSNSVSGIDTSSATSVTIHETNSNGFAPAADATVNFAAGSCSGSTTISNTHEPATAQAKKITDPTGYQANWPLTLTYPDGSTQTIAYSGSGFDSFGALAQEGTYTITEGSVSGFVFVSVSGDGADQTNQWCQFTVEYPRDSDKTFSCTFTNKSRGHAKVIKTVNGNAPSGSQSFTFTLRQGASTTSVGTILETKTADAGNGGIINFTTDLVPGNHYQLCEDVMPGWNTTLDSNLFVPGSLITPTLPNPDVNNMTVCSDFTVQPGETKTFNVDNSPPPGGRALTIGFWKNWASCASSTGKQKPVLDQTLAIAALDAAGGLVVSAGNAGTGWPNFAAPYYLILHANDCKKAVNLLNKSTATGGKKMASDPVFNMTAQLVAAQLNYFAGAGTNGPTTSNITKAVVLINGKYHFNGDTYTNGTTQKLSAADTTLANCLAKQLDNYNNDRAVSTC
jgi:hypothetical protein